MGLKTPNIEKSIVARPWGIERFTPVGVAHKKDVLTLTRAGKTLFHFTAFVLYERLFFQLRVF